MIYDVIEDNATWWVRLGKGVLVGPFAEHAEAVQWARGFAGDERDITVHRERKHKRLRLVKAA